MNIETRPVTDAINHILLHNLTDVTGRKLIAKGTRLTVEHIAVLQAAGQDSVTVAVLADEDVHEDAAAERIAHAFVAAQPDLLRATHAVGGRVNLHTAVNAVLYADPATLTAFNQLTGVTLATCPQHAVVGPHLATTQIATLKIIPYAIPAATVAAAVALAPQILRLRPIAPQRVALLITADEAAAPRLLRQFEEPTRARLERYGATLGESSTVTLNEGEIALASRELLASHDALIIGGQTSIMDADDTTPRALSSFGVSLTLHGAPVEPGNLLGLAYRDRQWIMMAPGCAKSPSLNVVDLVLPRLLAGETLTPESIAALGLGGLLE